MKSVTLQWPGINPYRGLPQQKWLEYERSLPFQASVPRSLAKPEAEKIQSVELHAFGDVSEIGGWIDHGKM